MIKDRALLAIRGIHHLVFLKQTSPQSTRGCDGEQCGIKKGLSVGKPAVEKTAKQAAVNSTKESSVIAQIRELVWIGQPTKALELASQVINLFQVLEH